MVAMLSRPVRIISDPSAQQRLITQFSVCDAIQLLGLKFVHDLRRPWPQCNRCCPFHITYLSLFIVKAFQQLNTKCHKIQQRIVGRISREKHYNKCYGLF